LRITFHSQTPEDFIIGKEYDFKVDSKYDGKFKIISVDGDQVIMELDETASAAYNRFITNYKLTSFSMRVE
jgi:hypothetical protein